MLPFPESRTGNSCARTRSLLNVTEAGHSLVHMPQQEHPGSATNKDLLLAALLGLVALVLFSRALGFGFINYDDPQYVYENPQVLKGLTVPGLKYALTTSDLGTWAPLTWLSYECDSSVAGMRAAWFHGVNLLLHAAAGALLFLALRQMQQSKWLAATVALFFLLHPLRQESVVWIAERKDVLCAFFWMAGLYAYARYAQRPSRRGFWLVFVCYLAGLMSKMMILTFPGLLLLLDFWPLHRVDYKRRRAGGIPELLREKLPLFGLGLLALAITTLALRSHGAFESRPSEGLIELLRIPDNYLFYIEKILWPFSLSILYPLHPVRPVYSLLGAISLGALTVAILKLTPKLPALTVGWLWFLVSLLPVVGVFAFGDFNVADRYTYVPSVGIFLGVASVAETLLGRTPRGLWSITLALSLGCALVTWFDLPRWRDARSINTAALDVGPHYVSFTNRGAAELADGDPAAALEDFNSAIRLNPRFAAAYNNRGFILSDLGKYEEAIKDFNRALECNREFANAYENRANALARQGETEKSLADYNRAIQLAPANPRSYSNRAAAYFELKRLTEAEADIQTCRRLGGQPHPGLVEALANALKTARDTK